MAHVLVSSIGQGLSHFRPDVYKTELTSGDRVLVCTDGLSGLVEDADIGRILGAAGGPEAACQALIDEANAAGGHDNITVAVAFCFPPAERSPGG